MPGTDELFGEIALRSKILKRKDLAAALASQEAQRGPGWKKVGEILVDAGVIKSGDVKNILHVQALMRVASREFQFGMDAIQAELVSDAQVEACLMIQERERHRRHIWDIMVEKGLITALQKDALLGKIETLHGTEDKLVETIRKAEHVDANSAEMVALQGARLEDAKGLVKEGVNSLVHLGLISHMVHRQRDTFTLKDFAAALDEDRKDIQSAIGDLVRIGVLTEEKGLLSTKYGFTSNQDVRLRVEILLLCVNDPKHRGEMFALLLHKT